MRKLLSADAVRGILMVVCVTSVFAVIKASSSARPISAFIRSAIPRVIFSPLLPRFFGAILANFAWLVSDCDGLAGFGHNFKR